MNKFIVLFSLCMATCTSVFAQSEDEDELVYVSTGCKTSAANTFHSSRYCQETKLCRHEHDKSAAKKCGDQCKHNGHVQAVELDKAVSLGKVPCSKCCKKIKKYKAIKKAKPVTDDED